MVKERIDERICRDCGKLIIGRRIDAIVCKDCRRKAQEEASQRIKGIERGERILRKAEHSWVKRHIEREKAEKILKALRKGPILYPNELTKDLTNLFRITPSQLVDAFGLWGWDFDKRWDEEDLKPIRKFIEEKVKEAKEEAKREFEMKRGKFRTSFDFLS